MSAPGHNVTRLPRIALIRRLVARLSTEAVVGGIGHTNFDLWDAGQRAQNFYMLGSMGLAVPIALGVALAQPDRRVIGLEGDGSLLMQLGCLATVAALAPRNLAILVLDNGTYEITGGQPTPAAATTDFAAVARGCGIAGATAVADFAEYEAWLDRALGSDGPHLACAKLTAAHPTARPERDPPLLRDRFMRGLGVR